MLDHLFKKETSEAPLPSDAGAASPVGPDETLAWQEKIRVAATDDTALLQLAHQAPTVPLKLAAIESLTREDSFKQAMHDFREHDKRLYRAARNRWQIASDTRIAHGEAQALIASARSLLEQAAVPVNRVVELDQTWAAVRRELLDEATSAEFAALSTQLGLRVRAHGEHAQAVTRWLAGADASMAQLQASLPGVAQGSDAAEDCEAQALRLLELVQAVPDAGDARCSTKTEAASRLLALASSVVQRAKFLQALPAVAAHDEAAEKQIIEQWRAFPEISEGELHTVLATRFAHWRNASTEERQREHDARSAQERARRAEQNQQRLAGIERDVAAAEAAQADGHVADLARLLNTIDNALKRGPVNAALTQRIEILRAEHRRLQEWQRWGGRQGREQLVTEAQALAEQVKGKVAIKGHADAIDKLRERWKELDKLGGASNQSLWLAFDGALEAAYAPVAAHLEKLKAARAENLAAREKIVLDLSAAAARFIPVSAAPDGDATASAGAPDWRAMAHALNDAQLAWRKLGPVEHTVPRKAQKGDQSITARYAVAVQALETPLKQAHAEARRQREELVAAANTLAASDVMARDVVDKVRKLQTQWQSVAKSQPLPRRDENALWLAFKAATDGIFTARDATRAAKEAETHAQQQARVEIIDRVAALARADIAAEIKRGLQEAESAWRAAPEAPRPLAAKLDARYRAARESASKRITELAAHAQQARFDALMTAMAHCQTRESSEADAADGDTPLDAIHNLPDAWKTRLIARYRGVAPAVAAPTKNNAKAAAPTLPDLLLNLEVACSLESPPEFQADRQRLKILALKNAMEARQSSSATPADIERWLLDAAAWPRPDELSRQRLAAIITSVRNRRLL